MESLSANIAITTDKVTNKMTVVRRCFIPLIVFQFAKSYLRFQNYLTIFLYDGFTEIFFSYQFCFSLTDSGKSFDLIWRRM